MDLLLSTICLNNQTWEIERSLAKNLNYVFYKAIVCGSVTNSIIGTAIREEIHLVICISRFTHIRQRFLSADILEILYKNEIFIISLGEDWVFNTPIGKKLATITLNKPAASIWNSNITTHNLHIGLKSNLLVVDLFKRLRSSVFYIPSKYKLEDTEIKSIVITKGIFDPSKLIDAPDMIISFELSSNLITHCFYSKIILSFVHPDIFYSEIARDLGHVLSNELRIPTKFCSHLQYKVKLK